MTRLYYAKQVMKYIVFGSLFLAACSLVFAQTTPQYVPRTGAVFTAPSINKTLYVDGTTYALTGAGLQSAINAGGAGATIVLPVNYAATITSAITISNSNVTLQCQKGATITAGTALSTMLSITGSNVTIDGCIFDNNLQAGNGTNVLTANGVDRLVFRNNKVLNIPNGVFGSLFVSSATNSDISHNYMTNVQGGGIVVQGAGHDVLISNNVIDGSNQPILAPHGGGTIIYVSATTSTGYTNVQVSDNTLTTATDFCIAIGGTTSHPYTNSSVSANTCYLKNTTGTNSCETAPASRACGGISVNGNQVTSGLAITDNVIYGAGQNVDISGIEVGGCLSCSVTGNNIQMTPGSSSPATGIINNTSTNTVIAGNLINGFTNAGAYNVGILSIAGDGAVISGNLITFPPDIAPHIMHGIELNCGANGLSIRNVSISGNTIIGNGASGSEGVHMVDVSAGSTCPVTAIVDGNYITAVQGGTNAAGAADVIVQNGINQFSSSVVSPIVSGNGAVNNTIMYGNVTAPTSSNVPFIRPITVQLDGTSRLQLFASQSGGGSFATHSGAGHLFLQSANNVIMQPGGGGTTASFGTASSQINALSVNGGTAMTANHGNGTSAQHSDGTGSTGFVAEFDVNGNITNGVLPPLVATLTTTAATSDNVTVTGMTSSGHCSIDPTNASAATNLATTFVSAKTTNQITVTHTATASMTYDVVCTAY